MTRRKESARFEWERVIRVLDLPATTKLVALTIATYADGETGRNAHPGEERLAADCSLTNRAIRTHLTRLRDTGLLQRTRKGSANQHRRMADEYALVVPTDLLERVELTPDYPGLRGPATGTPVPVDNDPLPEALFRNQHAATGT